MTWSLSPRSRQDWSRLGFYAVEPADIVAEVIGRHAVEKDALICLLHRLSVFFSARGMKQCHPLVGCPGVRGICHEVEFHFYPHNFMRVVVNEGGGKRRHDCLKQYALVHLMIGPAYQEKRSTRSAKKVAHNCGGRPASKAIQIRVFRGPRISWAIPVAAALGGGSGSFAWHGFPFQIAVDKIEL